jgi:hypothetical protein
MAEKNKKKRTKKIQPKEEQSPTLEPLPTVELLPTVEPVPTPAVPTPAVPTPAVPTPAVPTPAAPIPDVTNLDANKPEGHANKIMSLMETCVCDATSGMKPKNIPLCHASLQTVNVADLHAFKKEHPESNTVVETKMTHVMTDLQADEKYRVLGVYIALLIQDIDLAQESTGTLAQGAAGEVCQRLAGVVRQSLMARDARQQRVLPGWSILTIAVFGGLLLLLLFLTGCILALLVKKPGTVPKKL